MTSAERQRLWHTGLLGALLTAVMLIAWHQRLLTSVDRFWYDQRVRRFQFFNPPPTDRLLHVDVDDRTVDAVGELPLPRRFFAELVDELTAAGAKAIAFDFFFPEPQAPDRRLDEQKQWQIIENDQLFAQAVQRSRRVILPIAFSLKLKPSQQQQELTQLLLENLELDEAAATAALLNRKVIASAVEFDRNAYFPARREAIFRRVTHELEKQPDAGLAELRQRLFPKSSSDVLASGEGVFLKQYQKAVSLRMLARFARPDEQGLAPVLPVQGEFPPIPLLAQEAAGSAFVDYVPESDGIVRTVPLWVNIDGKLYPQLGLALACAHLGILPRDIKLLNDGLIIPRPPDAGGALELPTSVLHTPEQGNVGYAMPLPWFGPVNKWELMYRQPHDPPSATRQHLNAVSAHQSRLLREKLRANLQSADDAIKGLLELMDPSQLEAAVKHRLTAMRVEDALRRLDTVLADSQPWVDQFKQLQPQELKDYLAGLSEAERLRYEVFQRSVDVLPRLRLVIEQQSRDLVRSEAELRSMVQGKSVVIGWTAMGRTDFIPTSLHAKCPGSVVHGVIFNAIVTGDLWEPAPLMLTLTLTLIAGGVATALAAGLQPRESLLAALAFGALGLAFDGLLLFDYANLVLPAAPMVSFWMVWVGCIVERYFKERVERTHITSRFRSYVDPSLVDYVVENRSAARLQGETREMTVCFTDLAGFTRISEQLQERTVPLLNQYMSRMVPVIRRHHGYVNKFLGDGIMFFFGAPLENPKHAADAVTSVLQMQQLMAGFNEELDLQGLPRVAMRCGMATGKMVVGDAGPSDASDYTVLGDIVNLAARLEPANKVMGTRVLMNQRTWEMLGDNVIARPVGRIQVVGKSQWVMTYEPLAFTNEADDTLRELASLTAAMVYAYLDARFVECMDAAEHLEQRFGHSKLSDMYRKLATQHLQLSPGEAFDGCLVLEHK